jgi:hypothetical protein
VIDPKLFTVERLLKALLFDIYDNAWQQHAEIVPEYMPPYPSKDTRPRCVVKLGSSFLRCSGGPVQGYFWDIYGDDMFSPELALLALLQAPVPPWLLRRGRLDELSESFGVVTIDLPKEE